MRDNYLRTQLSSSMRAPAAINDLVIRCLSSRLIAPTGAGNNAASNHERIVEESTLLEVPDQRG